MHETASITQTRQSIIKVKAHTNMYETILVGIDGSEFSKAALINATNWVRRHGGRLFLVHAVYFDEEEFSIAPGQREKRFKLGKEMCYQTKEEVLPKLGKDVESLICEGEPHDVIVDVANTKNADLIAIGTHGRKGFKKLFMGSVTSRVIVSSPCDVLVVKNPLSEDPGQYKSILLSFDGSEFSKKALDRACELSKIEDAEITALYVIPHYDEIIEFFSTSLIKENLLHDAQKIVEEAKNLALNQGVSIKTEIAEGHAAEKIIDSAKRLGSDLIIRGTYGWRGIDKAIIGSIIENVIVNVSCPVLVVK
jgi:nucleotide-binding universal stress UspA family protein